jgi:alkylation response protein AidB-like acyl-CoA dehydrogenase
VRTATDGAAWQRYCELRSPRLAELLEHTAPSCEQVSRALWDSSDKVGNSTVAPARNLDAMAEAGIYGLLAPKDIGGLGFGYDDACEVAEELAGSCATTAFIWVQHLRLLGAMISPTAAPELVSQYRAAVVSGRAKGGVVLTGLMPGRPRLMATRATDGSGPGWVLNGEAPWFSGWGSVDLVVVVARTDERTG